MIAPLAALVLLAQPPAPASPARASDAPLLLAQAQTSPPDGSTTQPAPPSQPGSSAPTGWQLATPPQGSSASPPQGAPQGWEIKTPPQGSAQGWQLAGTPDAGTPPAAAEVGTAPPDQGEAPSTGTPPEAQAEAPEGYSPPEPNLPEPRYLLSLVEHDQNGKDKPIESNDAIVDINSDVEIHLAAKEIERHLPSAADGPHTRALVSDYTDFASTLARLTQAIAPLSRAYENYWKAPGDVTRGQLEQALQATSVPQLLVDFAQSMPAATSVAKNDLRNAVNQLIDNPTLPPLEQYRVLREAGQGAVASLKAELSDAQKNEGLDVMLGAFLVTEQSSHPIPLPGFAAYEETPRFTPEQWRLAYSGRERRALESAAQLLRDAGGADLGALLRLVPPQIVSGLGNLSGAVVPLSAEIARVRGQLGLTSPLRPILEQLGREAAGVRDLAEQLRQKYDALAPTASGEEFLLGTKADLDETGRRVRALEKDVGTLQGMLAQLPAGERRSLGIEGGGHLGEAVNAIDAAARKLSGELVEGLAPLFALHQLDTDAAAAGEAIRHSALESLPERTRVSLPSTGRRAPGDRIEVKLAVAAGDQLPEELEVRRLRMYRILLHLESAAAVIFATRPDIPGVGGGPFQVAPALSVLLQFGDRSLPWFDSLLTPGIGLSAAALDFDRDGTPELGLGGVVTVFHDVIQIGGGYNVFKSEGYFFFGLGLPLSNLSGGTLVGSP